MSQERLDGIYVVLFLGEVSDRLADIKRTVDGGWQWTHRLAAAIGDADRKTTELASTIRLRREAKHIPHLFGDCGDIVDRLLIRGVVRSPSQYSEDQTALACKGARDKGPRISVYISVPV